MFSNRLGGCLLASLWPLQLHQFFCCKFDFLFAVVFVSRECFVHYDHALILSELQQIASTNTAPWMRRRLVRFGEPSGTTTSKFRGAAGTDPEVRLGRAAPELAPTKLRSRVDRHRS